MEVFDFGKAISILKGGGKISRVGWNGRRKNGEPMYATIYKTCDTKDIAKPFLVMVHADDSIGVWNAVTNDILSTDWFEVE